MKRLIASNGMLSTLQQCSTKALLRTWGKSALGQPPKYLELGKAVHEAFEVWSRGATPDEAVLKFLKVYEPYSMRYLTFDDAYYHENAAKLLDVYFCLNPIATLPYEVVETEAPLLVDLGTFDGVQYLVSDKSDGWGRMKTDDSVFSIEYKTTGSYIGDDYLNTYELDSQMTTHVEALRQNGHDAKGVVLSILKIGKLPNPNAMTPKTGKPVTCRSAGHGLVRDCWMSHLTAPRFFITRTEDDIRVWRENAVRAMHRYRRLLEMNDLGLTAQEGLFGSCGRCDYLRFCKGHRQNMDSLLNRKEEEGVIYSGAYAE